VFLNVIVTNIVNAHNIQFEWVELSLSVIGKPSEVFEKRTGFEGAFSYHRLQLSTHLSNQY